MRILLGCVMWCEHYSLYAITKQEAFCVPWSLSLFLTCSLFLSLSLSLMPGGFSLTRERATPYPLQGGARRPSSGTEGYPVDSTHLPPIPHAAPMPPPLPPRRGRRNLRIYACTRVRARSARRGAARRGARRSVLALISGVFASSKSFRRYFNEIMVIMTTARWYSLRLRS